MGDARSGECDTWNVSQLLQPVATATADARYAVVMLNTPLPADQQAAFERLWQGATVRVCADGAANRLLDTLGEARLSTLALPTAVVGDLDSIRPDVRAFFEARVRRCARTH